MNSTSTVGVQLNGTDANDLLTGSAGGDTISGGNGSDLISGKELDDRFSVTLGMT